MYQLNQNLKYLHCCILQGSKVQIHQLLWLWKNKQTNKQKNKKTGWCTVSCFRHSNII